MNWGDLDIAGFNHPEYLYWILAVPVFVLLYFLRKKKQVVRWSHGSRVGSGVSLLGRFMAFLPYLLFNLVLVFTCIGMASPYSKEAENITQNSVNQGINIMVALDVSGSMKEEDFKPNRLEAAKNVIEDFAEGRKTDKMGLVIYGSESLLYTPLTSDLMFYADQVSNVQIGLLEEGTAIGEGLASAVLHLEKLESPNKVIILISDGREGENNVTPEEAVGYAVNSDITVYTIGVGSKGFLGFAMGFGVDEELLGMIADETGGAYFHASNTSALNKIFKEIDRIEKDKFESVTSAAAPPSTPYPYYVAAIILLVIALIFQRLIAKNLLEVA